MASALNSGSPALFAAADGSSETDGVKITSLKANNSNSFQKLRKVIDGNFVSYWLSSSAGSWIQAGLEKEAIISSMDIAWKNGDARSYYFTISASKDGKTFANVYQGESSGTTKSFENYDFAEVSARYLKITVNGNSADRSAKIAEIRIQTTPQAPVNEPDPDFDPAGEVGVWFYTRDFQTLDSGLVDDLLKRNINTIYFSAQIAGWDDPKKTAQYNAFIDYALSKDMQVFAIVLEDPTYVLMTEAGLTKEFGGLIEKIKTKTDGKINTFAIDVEPHSIHLSYPGQYPSYAGNEKFYLEKYVEMSRILRKIADNHGVKYIDTVPPSYHSKMIEVGISGGLNALSSHGVCVMAYQASIEKILNATGKILSDVKAKKIIITIKVTPGYGDPMLEGEEIPKAINSLKQKAIPIGIWSATDVMKTPPNLFP